MKLVDRLRLGGPNAMEVAGEAADEIERLDAAIRDALSHIPQNPGTARAYLLAAIAKR